MPIHWFPGHMQTARREIREAMPSVDLVIEVLDARIPFSSSNPLVAELRGEKPLLRILNKADLADPALTAAWITHFEATAGVRAVTHEHGQAARGFLSIARAMVPPERTRSRPLLAMIVGVPNVGKSTLINAMSGRSTARAENRPAVTREQQRVKVGTDLVLLDTPGFLWPRLSPAVCGYRLALTGAIADRVLDLREIAWFAARTLAERHPEGVARAYGLPSLPAGEEALLDAIGRRRGFLGRGGVVDLDKACERLVLDFRAGAFGRLTLETPERP